MTTSRIADKGNLYFVPIIMIIFILTLVFNLLIGTSIQQLFIHMKTVLVVACPCALGLSTSLAIVVAIGLFKNIGLEINSMIASCVMMLSSLFVVFNALRLKNIRNVK